MLEIVIVQNNAGQRLDKFCARLLSGAPKSFIYKMLRKKNITLNGSRADGARMLEVGDVVRFYLSSETLKKFIGAPKTYPAGFVDVIYEDEGLLIANKPAGLLTQPNVAGGDSLIGRLPGAAAINRLDRNTSGIVICAKNLPTAQRLSKLMHDRAIEKVYIGVAHGRIAEEMELKGVHVKDEASNTAQITGEGEGKAVFTRIVPISHTDATTTLLIHLHTGRSHQIRAHLQSIGHPLVGDKKYGGHGAKRQLLHAYQITLPEGTFTAPLPADMEEYSSFTFRSPKDFAKVRLKPRHFGLL
ncbi:MAG: RluA family pseudouridine synthase [Defluviitaleaceae bacterium]|nr:RluA family pseudouridine synthase [Defluviitaleaceae bacterium]